jgi:hypothetical protein
MADEVEYTRASHKNRLHRTLTEHEAALMLVAIEDSPTIYTVVAALMIRCPVCHRAEGHACVTVEPGALRIHSERLRDATRSP